MNIFQYLDMLINGNYAPEPVKWRVFRATRDMPEIEKYWYFGRSGSPRKWPPIYFRCPGVKKDDWISLDHLNFETEIIDAPEDVLPGLPKGWSLELYSSPIDNWWELIEKDEHGTEINEIIFPSTSNMTRRAAYEKALKIIKEIEA